MTHGPMHALVILLQMASVLQMAAAVPLAAQQPAAGSAGRQTHPASTRPSGSTAGSRVEDAFSYPEGFNLLNSDPRAIALVISCQETMGGRAAWEKVPAIRFAFVVERDGRVLGRRLHYWDRLGNRHRMERTDREGHRLIVSQNLSDRSGRAVRAGMPLAGADLKKALDDGYAAWVNDTYWLIMPFKATDPGVQLSYMGRRVRNRQRYQLVQLTFDSVGLTPGDTYWAWIDQTTRQMSFWAYRLEGTPADRPERLFAWEDWKEFGAIRLSLTKRQVEPSGGQPGLTIRFQDILLPGALPDEVFEPSHPVPPRLAP